MQEIGGGCLLEGIFRSLRYYNINLTGDGSSCN